MSFMTFHSVGNVIIPTDFIIFQRDSTTNPPHSFAELQADEFILGSKSKLRDERNSGTGDGRAGFMGYCL
jgi:hypothetical protein